VGLRMDTGATAIREETDGDFYFELREMGSSMQVALLGYSGGSRGPSTCV
jgi:hypothetical protein